MSKVCNYSAYWEPSVGATPWSRFEAACRATWGVAPTADIANPERLQTQQI